MLRRNIYFDNCRMKNYATVVKCYARVIFLQLVAGIFIAETFILATVAGKSRNSCWQSTHAVIMASTVKELLTEWGLDRLEQTFLGECCVLNVLKNVQDFDTIVTKLLDLTD